MLHGDCFGEEAGARDRWFFGVKWLQAAMKGYLVCAVVAAAIVSSLNQFLPLCSAMCGCSCVRTSRRLLHLWLQVAL